MHNPDKIIVVLHRTRSVVNIGGVIRAMKNMGFGALRLVEPAPFAAADITAIAHRSEDILTAARTYTSLHDALADTIYVVGTTEHARGRHIVHTDVRAFVKNILQQTAHGPVALLFGPEDNGLDTVDLDCCHAVVRLPTNPAYPSLNLAQAVLLLLYELRMEAQRGQTELLTTTETRQPATSAQLEALFIAWEQALHAIEFFKTPGTVHVMRRLRAVVHRAHPDQHEAAMLTAMAREVMKFLRRRRNDC